MSKPAIKLAKFAADITPETLPAGILNRSPLVWVGEKNVNSVMCLAYLILA